MVRGTLHTAKPRLTPTDRSSAIWYAWVEEVQKSGKNSYVVTICDRKEDTQLELRQADRATRLDLLATDENYALVKESWLETLPLKRVALDFGPLYRTDQIPQSMRELCHDRIPLRGNLTYFEASVPSGGRVTVLGCASPEAVHGCGAPPGAITVRGLRHILRAYANGCLLSIRGAAAFIGISLSLLAAALFKLREAAKAQP